MILCLLNIIILPQGHSSNLPSRSKRRPDIRFWFNTLDNADVASVSHRMDGTMPLAEIESDTSHDIFGTLAVVPTESDGCVVDCAHMLDASSNNKLKMRIVCFILQIVKVNLMKGHKHSDIKKAWSPIGLHASLGLRNPPHSRKSTEVHADMHEPFGCLTHPAHTQTNGYGHSTTLPIERGQIHIMGHSLLTIQTACECCEDSEMSCTASNKRLLCYLTHWPYNWTKRLACKFDEFARQS